MTKLRDRVAIITGGARGIGKAAALKFAEEGAVVAIWDVNEEDGAATVKELEAQGAKAIFQRVNTADLASVETAAQELKEQFGSIDVLINNAGITRDSSLKKMSADQWQSVIDVNLTGVFNCGKVISQHMLERKKGRIVNTSSVVGLYGNFGQSNYVAAKSGVIGLTKVWARELGRKGITVNAVAPGFIATEMTQKMPQEVLDGITSKIPMGAMGKPEDIANAYAFLASDDAKYINGAVISVDGGMVG